MRLLIFLLVLCSVTLPVTSYAGETYEPPDGVNFEVEGKPGIFFTLGEYQLIGLAYVELDRLQGRSALTNLKYELRLDIEHIFERRLET